MDKGKIIYFLSLAGIYGKRGGGSVRTPLQQGGHHGLRGPLPSGLRVQVRQRGGGGAATGALYFLKPFLSFRSVTNILSSLY